MGFNLLDLSGSSTFLFAPTCVAASSKLNIGVFKPTGLLRAGAQWYVICHPRQESPEFIKSDITPHHQQKTPEQILRVVIWPPHLTGCPD